METCNGSWHGHEIARHAAAGTLPNGIDHVLVDHGPIMQSELWYRKPVASLLLNLQLEKAVGSCWAWLRPSGQSGGAHALYPCSLTLPWLLGVGIGRNDLPMLITWHTEPCQALLTQESS